MNSMGKKILVTMDLEPDISRYLTNSYIGIEKRLTTFLELLERHGIVIDFFVTADVGKRYKKLIKKIIKEGHKIGCHGYDHSIQFYCKLDFKKQLDDISKATNEIEKIIGSRPTMFRAPNFSANADTIKVLEELNYRIDSSVLPGRIIKKWRILPIIDFRGAPREPYHPSVKNIVEKGNSKITEIPITENPLSNGGPIGMGYLNCYGLKKTLEAVRKVNSDYIIFLIHPWEMIDLRKYYTNLPDWVYKISKDNFSILIELLEVFKKGYSFSTLEKQFK